MRGGRTLHSRPIWELSEPWASELRGVFGSIDSDAPAPADSHFLHKDSGTEVAVSCLAPPHNQFCVVVIAPEVGPFQNTGFITLCVASIVIGCTPWIIGFVVTCGVVIRFQLKFYLAPHQNP